MNGGVLILDLGGLLPVQLGLERMARAERDRLYDLVGGSLESQSRERLSETKRDPEGEPWKEWSEDYAKRRPAKGGILDLDGDLIDSIAFETEKDAIIVGSNLVYALTHQEGDDDRRIPRRTYLGVSEQNLDDICDLTVKFFVEDFRV